MTETPTDATSVSDSDVSADEQRAAAALIGRELRPSEMPCVILACTAPHALVSATLMATGSDSVTKVLRQADSGPGVVDLGIGFAVAMGFEGDEFPDQVFRQIAALGGLPVVVESRMGSTAITAEPLDASRRSAAVPQMLEFERGAAVTAPMRMQCALGLVSPDHIVADERMTPPTTISPDLLRDTIADLAEARDTNSDTFPATLDAVATTGLPQPKITLVIEPALHFPSPECDAFLLEIPPTESLLVSRICGRALPATTSPRVAAQWAVVDACRAVSATGAKPIGLATGIGLGSATRVERGLDLIAILKGLESAGSTLDAAFVAHRVRPLQADTDPRAAVAVVATGLLERRNRIRPRHFRKAGESIVVIGSLEVEPHLDLQIEKRMQEAIREMVHAEFCTSVHAVGPDGLVQALVTACLGPERIGARLDLESHDGPNVLFAPTSVAYVVSLGFECLDGLKGIADDLDVACSEVGEVGGDRLLVSVSGVQAFAMHIAELTSGVSS